jgi:hypothetical protein
MRSSAKAEFERVLEACHAEFAPQSEHERFLVEVVAHARWKLQIIEQARARAERPELLDRYAASARKSHDRALRELRKRSRGEVSPSKAEAGRTPFDDTAYRA